MCNEIVGGDEPVVGKHLLDVFDVEADDSTTLEALRMEAPVRYRFWTLLLQKREGAVYGQFCFSCENEWAYCGGSCPGGKYFCHLPQGGAAFEKLQSAIKEKVSVSSDYRRNTGVHVG